MVNHPNRSRAISREEQLACAYQAVASANHYMIGIIEKVTENERDEAEQILISKQNCISVEDSPEWKVLDLALDILAEDRKRSR
jgi:hypothetical protein